jgi:hypothetical protein
VKTFKIIALTALVAFPLGVIADPMLKGHPNLQHARDSLNDADSWITKSQQANEAVWKDEGGHGQKAKEFIHNAKEQLDLAAQWVNNHK